MNDPDRKTYQATFLFLTFAALFLAVFIGTAHASRHAEIGTAKRSFTPEQRAECRYRGANKTEPWSDHEMELVLRCASRVYPPPGGASTMIAIGNCESGLEREPSPSSQYHGPMQYLASTYASQRRSLPAVRHRFEIPPAVHSVRGQLVLATAWVSKRSASPWGCA